MSTVSPDNNQVFNTPIVVMCIRFKCKGSWHMVFPASRFWFLFWIVVDWFSPQVLKTSSSQATPFSDTENSSHNKLLIGAACCVVSHVRGGGKGAIMAWETSPIADSFHPPDTEHNSGTWGPEISLPTAGSAVSQCCRQCGQLKNFL